MLLWMILTCDVADTIIHTHSILTNNHISFIPAGFLDHTPSLEKLWLIIWYFFHYHNLTCIKCRYLNYNRITSLPVGLFSRTIKLHILFATYLLNTDYLHHIYRSHLNVNQIASISASIFEYTPLLHALYEAQRLCIPTTNYLLHRDLRFNSITSIPTNFLANMNRIQSMYEAFVLFMI